MGVSVRFYAVVGFETGPEDFWTKKEATDRRCQKGHVIDDVDDRFCSKDGTPVKATIERVPSKLLSFLAENNGMTPEKMWDQLRDCDRGSWSVFGGNLGNLFGVPLVCSGDCLESDGYSYGLSESEIAASFLRVERLCEAVSIKKKMQMYVFHHTS